MPFSSIEFHNHTDREATILVKYDDRSSAGRLRSLSIGPQGEEDTVGILGYEYIGDSYNTAPITQIQVVSYPMRATLMMPDTSTDSSSKKVYNIVEKLGEFVFIEEH